ncbi:hypothetical protein CHS0354_005798 [Potamilus streckersoni]|uniref:SAM domain-containing protein n=1 Tax=Potamilus streckersoni TaxID=2493646 RepID=A0AAE0W2X8_9BIVA|nr:hypothetical protein CHS0354_005798 [Potamilus streckersoni]
MDYDTKVKDYTLGEFYELYKDKLPTIIRVTEGFCGEILEETIDYGQVIRINSACRQRRVIAVRLNDQGAEECTYSLPVNYPIQAHLEEIYKNGELDLQIVRIPLHLYAIRFSEVTRLRGKSKSDWEAFKTKLDRKAIQLNYDAVCGNPEIAKYKSRSSSKIKILNEMEATSFIYENLQLQTYTNVRDLMGKNQSSQSETASADIACVYETVDICPTGDIPGKKQGKKSIPKQNTEQKKGHIRLHLPPKPLLAELTARFRKDQIPITKPDVRPKPPKLNPKPKLNGNTQETTIPGQSTLEDKSGKEVDNSIPPIPPRPLSCLQTELDTRNTSFTSVSDCYENMKIGRAEVHPMSCSKSGTLQKLSVTQDEKYTVTEAESHFESPSLEQNEDGNDQANIEVKDFKVNELGKWMTDKLRLGKYAARFAEELVDGATLLDLDENILKQEFGFSSIEAKRLMKFAKEGHIPQ